MTDQHALGGFGDETETEFDEMPEPEEHQLTAQKPPNARELHAYNELLRIQRAKGRRCSAHEAWPHVRHMSRLRRFAHVEPKRGDYKTNPTLAPQQQVMRTVFALEKRVIAYLADTKHLEEQRSLIANDAMVTALECLTHGGAYDQDPRLLKEKGKIALELIRICGLSKEQKSVSVDVNAKFGDPVPDDDVAANVEARKQLAQERLGGRLAGIQGSESLN